MRPDKGWKSKPKLVACKIKIYCCCVRLTLNKYALVVACHVNIVSDLSAELNVTYHVALMVIVSVC